MFWVILFVVCILGLVFFVPFIDDHGPLGANEAFNWIFGIVAVIAAIGSVFFFVSIRNLPIDISKYNQRYEQITYKLESFSDNANFSNQFSDSLNKAMTYNSDILDEQNSYKYWGMTFTYRNKKVNDLKSIDLSKYKIINSSQKVQVQMESK